MRLGIAPRRPTRPSGSAIVEGVLAADVLVVTGGVSVGARDVVKDVFEEIGTLELWRVAIQPGKPLAYRPRTRARTAAPASCSACRATR